MSSPAQEDQPFEPEDRRILDEVAAKLAKLPSKVNIPFAAVAAIMMAVLYFMGTPWWVSLFMGLFLLAMLIGIDWALRYQLRLVRGDLDAGRKVVMRGRVTEKWIANENNDHLNKTTDIRPFFSTGQRHYIKLDGQTIQVPSESYGQMEIGDRIALHMLPKAKLVFRAQPWTTPYA